MNMRISVRRLKKLIGETRSQWVDDESEGWTVDQLDDLIRDYELDGITGAGVMSDKAYEATNNVEFSTAVFDRAIELGFLSEGALHEAAGDEDTNETGSSLDAQVDRYLTQYESTAKNAKHEGRDLRALAYRLFEADNDTSDASTAPSKLPLDDIDMEEFANNVFRLIENYDSLLEVRNTVLRRATDFIKKSYEEDAVKKFNDVMREQHGMVVGKSQEDVEDEDFAAPAGDRAGPDIGGGGGAAG